MTIRYDAIFSNKMVLFVSLLYEVKWMHSRLKTYTFHGNGSWTSFIICFLNICRISTLPIHCSQPQVRYHKDLRLECMNFWRLYRDTKINTFLILPSVCQKFALEICYNNVGRPTVIVYTYSALFMASDHTDINGPYDAQLFSLFFSICPVKSNQSFCFYLHSDNIPNV